MSNQQWNSGPGSNDWGQQGDWNQQQGWQGQGAQDWNQPAQPQTSAQDWNQAPVPDWQAQPPSGNQDWGQQHNGGAQEWGQAQPQTSAQEWGQVQPQTSAQDWGQAPSNDWQTQPSGQEWNQAPSGTEWPAAAPGNEWQQQPQQQQQEWTQQQPMAQPWPVQGYQQPAQQATGGGLFDFSIKQLALPKAAGLAFILGSVGLGVEWLFNLITSIAGTGPYGTSAIAVINTLLGGLGGVLVKLIVLRVIIEIAVATTRLLKAQEKSDDS